MDAVVPLMHHDPSDLGSLILIRISTKKRTYSTTVKPPVSGRLQDQKKWPLKRGVRLWEVKNVVFVCS